jgi:hypothetical protein
LKGESDEEKRRLGLYPDLRNVRRRLAQLLLGAFSVNKELAEK